MKNRTVACIFLIITILWLLGAVFFVQDIMLSGMVVANGTVSVQVDPTLAVSIVDNEIDFGSCTVGADYSIFDSSLTATGVNNGDCDGTVDFPAMVVIQNDGNSVVNISVQSDVTGQELFDSSNSWFAYKTMNTSLRGGCVSGLQESFENISSTVVSYSVCEELSFSDDNDQVALFIRMKVSSDASKGGSSSLTFVAS